MRVKFINLRNLIPVIISGLILSSCSKDSTPADNMIGTWTMQSATFNAMIGTKTLTQYLIDDLGFTATDAQQFMIQYNAGMQQAFTGTIQLKSDHTYTSTLGGETDTGTWSLSSDEKKLTIDSSSLEPMILDVIELTSSILHLQGVEYQFADLNNDGTQETVTVTVDLTLKK
jgi:hypothetical protein